jgi:hypothetical protein
VASVSRPVAFVQWLVALATPASRVGASVFEDVVGAATFQPEAVFAGVAELVVEVKTIRMFMGVPCELKCSWMAKKDRGAHGKAGESGQRP